MEKSQKVGKSSKLEDSILVGGVSNPELKTPPILYSNLYHKKGACNMKKLGPFILLCCLTFGLVTTVMSQVYFEDNFEQASDSENNWALFGNWQFANGQYQQTTTEVNCVSILADDAWMRAGTIIHWKLKPPKSVVLKVF